MDIRSLQRPLKDLYRQDPASSRITLTARGTQTDAPIACSVDLGRAIYKAQAHIKESVAPVREPAPETCC